MKKLLLTMLTICMMFSITYGYNLTKIVQGNKVTRNENEGRTVYLKYIDTAGYVFNGWVASGVTLTNPNTKEISFVMPANDVTIEVNMSESVQQYKLTQTIGEVTQVSMRDVGESITLTAVPETGYRFTGWTATGITLTNTESVTFTMPANDVTITANFEANTPQHVCSYTGTRTCDVNGSTDTVQCSGCNLTESQTCVHTYTITATQGSNGNITLSSTSVKAGGTATATITPNSGYEINSVTVNGSGAGKVSTYTFSNVTSNQTITASYVIDKSTLAIGTYIQYTPSSTSYTVSASNSGYTSDQTFNPSATTLWRVMYNNNGQLDIISADSTENLYLQGKTGYAKGVNTLNSIGQAYVNNTYATSGRHIGSTSNSIGEIDETTIVKGVSGEPYNDSEYETDVNQIENNGLLHSNEHGSGLVWLASRNCADLGVTADFTLNFLYYEGGGVCYYNFLYEIYHDPFSDYESELSYELGIRPVVSLKSNIYITGGSGTSSDPYQISI